MNFLLIGSLLSIWYPHAVHSITVDTFGVYPGYDNSLAITGDGWVVDIKLEAVKPSEPDGSKHIIFDFNFQGLRINATGGWHAHIGTSCSDHALVLGHYKGSLDDDPWSETMWKSDPEGNAFGRFILTDNDVVSATTYYNELLLRTIVVHDSAAGNGERIACGSIPTTTKPFSKMSDYDGAIAAAGGVTIGATDSGKLKISYSFTGLEESVTAGWHIHDGPTCDDVGPHYNPTGGADPWKDTQYTTNDKGEVSGSEIMEDIGIEQINNRVVVIHASDAFNNIKVACAKIPRTILPSDFSEVKELTVDKFGKFPEYDGDKTVGGSVTIKSIKDTVSGVGMLKFEYSFTGLKASSTGGWHVHTGTSCNVKSKVLGHYEGDIGSDPWKNNMWESDDQGDSSGVVTFTDANLGGDAENYFWNILLRTVVVHDFDGEKIACSNIPTLTKEFTKFPGYDGTIDASGSTVSINGKGSNLDLTYTFQGLEASVTGGWHIHEGENCEDVGGHYKGDLDEDPWKDITYTSDDQGMATNMVTVEGNKMEDINNRVIVIHNSDNDKVACAEIYHTILPTEPPTPGAGASSKNIASSQMSPPPTTSPIVPSPTVGMALQMRVSYVLPMLLLFFWSFSESC